MTSLGEDPTTAQLELEIVMVTGKAAALFVTSGTMGNQLGIAIRIASRRRGHRRRGGASDALTRLGRLRC